MSDIWILQEKAYGQWVDFEDYGEIEQHRQYRWRHDDGHTQPARTDDDGRLLGPVDLDAVLDRMRNSGVDPTEYGLTDDHLECLYDMLDDYELVTTNESGLLVAHDPSGGLRNGAAQEFAKALADDESQYEVMTLDGAMPDLQEAYDYCDHVILGGQPEPERGPDPHIRAQLVDGLPGAWRSIRDSGLLWSLDIGGAFRAVVHLPHDPSDAHAEGSIVLDGVSNAIDGPQGGDLVQVPHTRVEADGDDYIMVCAQKLAPKVDATREFVERLRD